MAALQRRCNAAILFPISSYQTLALKPKVGYYKVAEYQYFFVSKRPVIGTYSNVRSMQHGSRTGIVVSETGTTFRRTQ